MASAGFLLAALLLGHLCILVTSVNVIHGVGLKCRSMDLIVYGALAVVGVGTLAAVILLSGMPPQNWPRGVQGYAVACLSAALIGFPLSLAQRALRRLPLGITSAGPLAVDFTQQEPSRDLIGQGVGARLLALPGNQSLRLTVERWDLTWPGLPAPLDGLKLLHLTDLHLARGYGLRYFEAVAEMAAAQEADLVAFTGDLIDDPSAIDWIAPVLGRIHARLGGFAILGNHDIYYDQSRIRGELSAAGFVDVDGRWTTIDERGWTLAIGGTSAPWGPDLSADDRPEADASLVLSHTPDRFPRLAALNVDLVLSGHNHGGQVRLPVIGPVLMPSRYSRRYDMGFFRSRTSTMYVSRGVAGKHPLRYGCPPEITTFTLRSPAKLAPRPSSRRSQEEVVASTV